VDNQSQVQIGETDGLGNKILISFERPEIRPGKLFLIRDRKKNISVAMDGIQKAPLFIGGQKKDCFIKVQPVFLSFSLKGDGSIYLPYGSRGEAWVMQTRTIKLDTAFDSLWCRALKPRMNIPKESRTNEIKKLKMRPECWDEAVMLFNPLELKAIRLSISQHNAYLKTEYKDK